MGRKYNLGTLLFCMGMTAMGTLSVIYRDFAFDWQPVPAFHPGREALAVLCGLFMICASAALLFRSSAPYAARAMLLFLLAWLCLKIPAVMAAPQVEGVWLGFGEIGMLFAGGWVLFARLSGIGGGSLITRITGVKGARLAQIVFGCSLIPVGLGHLFYGSITASMVPVWLPFRMEIAYLTGVVQIACGLAILFSILPRVAAISETFLLALFAFLVWGPDTWIASTPKMAGTPQGPRFPLTAFLITWMIAASAILVADSYITKAEHAN